MANRDFQTFEEDQTTYNKSIEHNIFCKNYKTNMTIKNNPFKKYIFWFCNHENTIQLDIISAAGIT